MTARTVACAVLVFAVGCTGNKAGGRADTARPLVDTGAVPAPPNAMHAPAPPPGPKQAPPLTPANMLAMMTLSNETEIQAGQAAASKAVHPDVKAFARALVTDHGQLQALVDSVAGAMHLAPVPPPSADTMARHDKHVIDSVAQLNGVAFERAFLVTQVEAHRNAVTDLNHFASLGPDSLLRNLIIVSDRRVQDHLLRAQKLLPLVGGKTP
jgi:putative membrane protein